MSSKRAQLGIIFLTILIDMIGFGIVIPVLPLYAEHYGATAMQNGFLVAIFSLAQFVCAPLWGRLSDRVGRKPVLFVSILGTAVGFLLMGLAGSLCMLFVARFIDGAAGGNIGTAQAYIADISSPQERAKSMGLIGAAFGLGFMFGPAIGGWVGGHFGFQAPMYLAAAMALVNAVLVLVILPESLPVERRGAGGRGSIFDVLQHCDRRVYLSVSSAYFLLTTGFSMMTFVYALFVFHRFGIGPVGTGNLLALVGFIGVLIQGGLIGRLVKHFGESRLATGGAVILSASLLALPMASSMTALLLASAGVAIGNSLLMPTLTSLASRSVDANWQGRGLGLLQSGGSLARWVGPAVGGWLLTFDVGRAKELYARSPLWAGAILVAASIFFTLALPRTISPVAAATDEPSAT
jgi:MFS transporter, DHA1 family, tetracycline resistance protein